MKRTDKNHINERLRTTFADSGRAAGIGVLYDRYDEDSGLARQGGSVRVRLPSDNLTPDEREALNSPVVVYKEGKANAD